MGLTKNSVGIGAMDNKDIMLNNNNDLTIALAGNPNVGKSSIFNAITGLKQHTGNWPGKTVTNAVGSCTTEKNKYSFVDIPGTYSLMAHSAEEEVARNFLCFDNPDAVIVVCDATCIERNLNLVLQIMEISKRVIVCINLMDEAKRKGIQVNFELLTKRLGVPVVESIAHKKSTVKNLLQVLDAEIDSEHINNAQLIKYPEALEAAIDIVESKIPEELRKKMPSRWLALRLIEKDTNIYYEIKNRFGEKHLAENELNEALYFSRQLLKQQGIDESRLKDIIAASIVKSAEEISVGITKNRGKEDYTQFDRKIDRILTNKVTGYPIMLLLLCFIFWLTISGANYPSTWLYNFLFNIGEQIRKLFQFMHFTDTLIQILIDGAYRVLASVVSVMLPPMAIFFPLFTLLEDSGYLPRIAYNLDNPLKKCNACGKQALTMCMGFGCNAAGVVGCRIIDSPRERLLAILTNAFVPCNGRFPTFVTIISIFFISTANGLSGSIYSTLILAAIILLGVFLTFGVTFFLSKTLLKGIPSSFILELPPYRRPQVLKIIIRSVFDRTLFVLGRAAAVAAPMGVLIWIMANIKVGDSSILNLSADFLDPLGKIMGLDGVILLAFILGFPANEIIVPIIMMAYLSETTIAEAANLSFIHNIFETNGWTINTAICFTIFMLVHWPCSTTLLTIKKETDSLKWTLAAFLMPTIIGIVLCILFNSLYIGVSQLL